MTEQKIVADVFNEDGTLYDQCYTWETGQNFALSEGYRVVATADDGFMKMAAAQAMYDSCRAQYRDCYGLPPEPVKPVKPEMTRWEAKQLAGWDAQNEAAVCAGTGNHDGQEISYCDECEPSTEV